MSHRYRGVCGANAAYADGSVAFNNNQDVFSDNLSLPPGVGLSGKLWDVDPSLQSGSTIYAIYYYRFLAIFNPSDPKFLVTR